MESREMKFFQRIADLVNDYANPVMVKELRQSVQSRLVILLLLLFLFGNVVAVCSYLTFNVHLQTNPQAGRELFQGLFTLLASTTIIFVPVYTAVRMTMERNNSNMDLLFITTLPPQKIVLGKLWAAIALTSLIYSACLPFLTLTYLLRGIDLPSIFSALVCAFLITTVLNMGAIFVGSVQGTGFLRLLLAAAFLYAVGLSIGAAIGTGYTISRVGVTSMFGSWEAWGVFGTIFIAGLGAFFLEFFLAVAAMSPRSSNRMFPTRVYLTVCWGLSLLVALCWSYRITTGPDEIMTVWMVMSITTLSSVFGLVLAEREQWGVRVKKTIPRNLIGRSLAFLFYTGSAGGVIWCSLLVVSTFLIWQASQVVWSSSNWDMERNFYHSVILAMLYVWCYGMTGLYLRRLLFPKTAPLMNTILGLVLFAICSTVPVLIANYVFDIRGIHELPVWSVIMNPFSVLNDQHFDRRIAVAFVLSWSLVGLLVNIPWFRQQWNEFRRHETQVSPLSETPETPAQEVEAAVING
jgi:hypothetical protein